DDVLAEIGLPDFNAILLQQWIEVNLLGDHGLRLDDGLDVVFFRDLENVIARLFAIRCPEDVSTTRRDRLFELDQILIESAERFGLDLCAAVAGGLPIGKPRLAFVVSRFVAVDTLADGLAMTQIK